MRRRRRDSELFNLAAMIDVVFLLLVFFLVSYRDAVIESLVPADLPSPAPRPRRRRPALLTLAILPDGCRLGTGGSMARVEVEDVHSLLTPYSGDPDFRVRVTVHPDVEQHRVMAALDQCHRAGVRKLALLSLKR